MVVRNVCDAVDAPRVLVALPAQVVEALLEHRKRTLAAGFGGCEFVSTNQSGGRLRRSHFHKDEFKPLLKRAGLDAIRFHSLRHTHASLLLLQGVHPKVVQERLGHSPISVTMDVYSHLLLSMQTDAVAKLDALMVAAPAENGSKMAVKAG